MGLDEVWVIPAAPVHRTLSGRADGATRLKWLQRIFTHTANVRVVDWEIRRGRAVPAVETLRWFRAEQPDVVPWFMMGADAWAGLPTWREYPAHMGLCNVAVFARRGEPEPAELDGWAKLDGAQWPVSPGHWRFLAVDLPEVSATEIRHRLETGEALTGLIPAEIKMEIEQQYAQAEE